MWFSLFSLVLILAIMFYQGLLGVFTSAINCILAVLAAAIAFGLYENVYYDYLLSSQPDDGRAIALVGIFIVSLLIMRLIVDQLITGNLKFSVLVDRLGGGAFGFVTAMVIIGVLATGIQMLSFPPRWLGFSRYAMVNTDTGETVDLSPKEEKQTELNVLSQVDLSTVQFRRRSLWLNPDGFAVAIASFLSDNALAGESKMSQVHPQLLDENYWARFSPAGQVSKVARKQDAIQVEACWELPAKSLLVVTKGKERGQAALSPAKDDDKIPSGFRLVAVRAKLSADATDDNSQYRFTTNQVQLVTKSKRGNIASYGLVGINAAPENLAEANGKDLYFRLNENEPVSRTNNKFDFVFQIPEDTDPWYIVYRINARAEIRAVQKSGPKTPVYQAQAKKESKPNKKQKQPNKTEGNTANDKGSSDSTAGNNDAGKTSNNGGSQATGGSDTKDGDGTGTQGRGGRTSRVHSKLDGHFFGYELPFELTSYNGEAEVSQDALTNGRITAVLNQDDSPVSGSSKPIKRIQPPDKNVRLLHLSMERVFPGSLYGQALDFAAQNNPVKVKDANGKTYTAIGMYVFGTVGGKRTFELVYFDETNRISSAAIAKPERIQRQHMKPGDQMFYLFEVPPGTEIVSFFNPKGAEENLRSAQLVAK